MASTRPTVNSSGLVGSVAVAGVEGRIFGGAVMVDVVHCDKHGAWVRVRELKL